MGGEKALELALGNDLKPSVLDSYLLAGTILAPASASPGNP